MILAAVCLDLLKFKSKTVRLEVSYLSIFARLSGKSAIQRSQVYRRSISYNFYIQQTKKIQKRMLPGRGSPLLSMCIR